MNTVSAARCDLTDGYVYWARRKAWLRDHPSVPMGMRVVPTCGNDRCLAHLALETQSDTIRRARDRGRLPFCKLDMDRAEEIRRLSRMGEPVAALAARFGVAITTIRQILRGRSWT